MGNHIIVRVGQCGGQTEWDRECAVPPVLIFSRTVAWLSGPSGRSSAHLHCAPPALPCLVLLALAAALLMNGAEVPID